MGVQDFILGPFYLGLILLFALKLKGKLVKTPLQEEMYFKILLFKIFAVTFFAFIYQFYYGGGDTFGFYNWTKKLVEYFFTDPSNCMSFIFQGDLESFYRFKYHDMPKGYGYLLQYGSREVSYIKMLFPINLICLNSYLAVSYMLTFFVFIANWLLYRVFAEKYPDIGKSLIYSTMLIPSVCFWGGGILKDTVAYMGICLIIYTISETMFHGRKIIRNVILFVLFTYIIVTIRGFVVLSILPAVIFWIFNTYKDKISSGVIRTVATPFLLITSMLLIFVMLQLVGNELDRFSLDQLDKTIQDFQGWHAVASENGSGYTLHISGTSPIHMLMALPQAINVTYFRPYLWEASGAVVLFSAVESTFILFYFLRVFFIKSKVFGFFRYVVSEPLVQLCLIFAILYGFSVGFTSYNFGALSRYKLAAMPFFCTMLVIIGHLSSKASSDK